MPSFSYKGRNNRGELMQGILESSSSSAVAKQLIGLGIIPIEISVRLPAEENGRDRSLFAEPIKTLDLMLFSRQMYTLLKAGIPIMSALNGLQLSARNKSFAKVIADIRASLDSGRELSNAFQAHPTIFNNFYLNMIRVGETTGRLDQIFLRLFDHLEFEKVMQEQIKAALRYPIFVVIAIAVALVIVNLFVIPVFAKMFSKFGADLPLMTRILLGFSDFMMANWVYLLLATITGLFLFRLYTKAGTGKQRWDGFKLKIPIAGPIIYKATMARFARSFALASKSGVPLMNALSLVAQTVDNDFVALRIEQMRNGVERGESILHTAATSGVFNPLVLQMIAVGEESGALDDLMEEIADMYQRDVEYDIKNLSAQIEPLLIIFLGIMVLILALGIFLPLWDFGKVAAHRG